MLSLSSLIEFLLDMLRDPATQNDFARDPNGTLAARGLSGITAEDVRDVQPMLADHSGVSASVGGAHAVRAPHVEHPYAGHGPQHAVHGDPVRAIQQVTNEYEVDNETVVRNVTQEYAQYTTYKTYLTDNSVHAENGGTVIQDSFNQDNDGIDLKGADVDDSVIAGQDANGSGNETDSTTTQDAYNDDYSVAVNGSGNDTASHDDPNEGSTSSDSFSGSSVDDSYAVHDPPGSAAFDDGADATGAQA